MSGFNNIIQRGKPLTIKDEGITLATDVDSIDFAGTGVTGSFIGTAVTETFTGGGSSTTSVSEEVPSGSGTSFTLANTPTSGTLKLYRGGSRQQLGIGNDYTLSGTTITLAVALSADEILIADYEY